MEATKLYKMQTVTRRTGFSPAVLRAWEKRHGILSPQRGAGGHRLYTEDDLKLLGHVRRLLGQGRSIGEISTAGRETLLREAADPNQALLQTQTAALPSSNSLVDGIRAEIVQAALDMDSDRIEDRLDDAFALIGAERVIHDIIERSARRIGELWIQGQCTIASEHLASGLFVHRMRKLLETAGNRARSSTRIIFSCFPDENHELGLLILAYHFTKRGSKVCYLGPALPFEDLERACDTVMPGAVILSVTRRSVYLTHKPRLIELLRRRIPGIKVFVGGQGAPEDDHELTESGGQFCPNGKPTPIRVEEILSSSL